MRLVTPLEMMKLEEKTNQAGISYETMMDRAGAGLAEHLKKLAAERECSSILFLCGNGNNAGDCFVAASLLSKQLAVTVCLLAGVPKTRTAYTKFKMMKNVTVLEEQNAIREAVQQSSLIADGIFGIGFRGTLSPFVKELTAEINGDPDKYCVAVDIPSGGSGLNGAVAEGTLHCDMTVTFGAAKLGLMLAPLSEYCGAIYLVEIGIPDEAFNMLDYPVSRITPEYVHENLPRRPANAHKGMFGRLFCVAGSRNMPGAAILASKAALRSGVGLYCLASDADVCRMLIAQAPEAMIQPLPSDADGKLTPESVPVILEKANPSSCVLIGCGLGQSEALRRTVNELITNLDCPIILDADGLNAIASGIDILRKAKSKVVLTPHPGEMSRLLHCSVEEVQKDRLKAAKRFAARFPNTVIVLKGAGTVVATAEHAAINTTGNSGMSKGGSGDVLAGMIASLTAQGSEPELAAIMGVYLHGLAGDCAAAEFSRRAMLPSDLINQLPLVFGEYD
ncbi:MAG: NAD(P)H-hydrate dehydratase [Oscillospiraceae bacterium]|nr:NAD(P)H-hydrate dehydratase [Oscillospiraceae bacterium]